MVDLSVAKSMAKRMGVQMSHLEKRLMKAFEVFSNHAINSLDIRLPDPESVRQMDELQLSLHILARFQQASKMNGLIRIEKDGRTRTLPVIKNHLRQDDPNLTLLAGLNRMSSAAMEKLIRTTLESARKEDDDALKEGIYNAIITAHIPTANLKRPPLDINASLY